MNLVFEKLSQSLAANQVWPVGIAAEELRIVSAFWPVTVELRKGGLVVGIASNMQAGDFVRDVPFDEARITNGANAQSVAIALASGGMGSDRITGEVSVVDGSLSLTQANRAFWGGTYIGASPANYPHVQCWNPAGSGRTYAVRSVVVTAQSNTPIGLRLHTAALSTSSGALASKLGGGASAAAETRWQQNPTLIGAVGLSVLYVGANAPLSFDLQEPIIMPPGYGVIAMAESVNVALSASFQIIEVQS